MNKLLVILIFIYSFTLFAETKKVKIWVTPKFLAKTCTEGIEIRKKDVENGEEDYKLSVMLKDKKKMKSCHDYDKAIIYLRNEYPKMVDNYIKSFPKGYNIELQKNEADADYLLTCGFAYMKDELTWKTGFLGLFEKSKGIYYMQINCKITNIKTNHILNVTEGKIKYFTDGLFSLEDLKSRAKKFIKRKFPKPDEVLLPILKDISFKNPKIEYEYNDENNKKANGKEKGKIKIILNEGDGNYLSKNSLTEFSLTAKQGKFTENMSKTIKFTDAKYLKNGKKIDFEYQTYNCNDEKIKDKKFETFILEITEQLTKKKKISLKEIKVPFECQEPFYTVTTIKKEITNVKPVKKYRGLNKPLKSFIEDKSIYYIYIDVENAKIIQYHVDKLSTRKIHREKYKLNGKNCKYEIVKKDKLVKNLGGRDILDSEDAGWGFEDDSKIYVKLPIKERFSFTWKKLRDDEHYSKNKKYKKKIPKISKDILNGIAKLSSKYTQGSANSKEIDLFKGIFEVSPLSREDKCYGKVSVESLLIKSFILKDPDVKFQIDIKPSTKNEIKILKKYKNIK